MLVRHAARDYIALENVIVNDRYHVLYSNRCWLSVDKFTYNISSSVRRILLVGVGEVRGLQWRLGGPGRDIIYNIILYYNRDIVNSNLIVTRIYYFDENAASPAATRCGVKNRYTYYYYTRYLCENKNVTIEKAYIIYGLNINRAKYKPSIEYLRNNIGM